MSSLSYIAILGRQPELSLLELESLVGPDGVAPFGREAAMLGRPLDIDRLGGTIKTGQVMYRGPVRPLRELPVEMSDFPDWESKLPFALSVYGMRLSPSELMAAGLQLKKKLKTRGSVRLVVPARGLAVSAAELKHNHVLDDGFELLVVAAGGEMIVARTTGVQDVDWYSRRDYGRPARSAKVGMLPPKLAQMLVNTTSAAVVADPFCGTGVVLAEALLAGRKAVGSDLSAEMVEAGRANLPWLERETGASLPEWSVTAADAREVRLPADCAVVSEGYLGTHLTHSPAPSELQRLRRELLDLYRMSLRHWARQLPSGAEVSLCVPAWRVQKRWQYLGLVDELPELGYTLKRFQHARTPLRGEPSALLYARDDQVVGRQLLLLRKN